MKFFEKIKQKGSILVFEVVLIFVFTVALISLLSVSVYQLRVVRSSVYKEQAFQIAEAGANYYQWHLAHYATDYADGTGQVCSTCGPYIHDYVDQNSGKTIGKYSLTITKPLTGSTVTTIESTGWTTDNPNVKRKVTVRYGIPSLAKFAFLTNSDVWVGDSESVNGEMHSNGGIRFDGTGNAPITSAKTTYSCQTYHGCGPTTRPGIWGAAPAATQSYWDYPVPNYDFSSISADLGTIKTQAQASGIYLAPVNPSGYSLVFNNNNTVTVYRVTSLRSHASGTDVEGNNHSEDIDYNARSLVNTYAIPANGLIYVEDEVWVEGTVSGRVMVAAAASSWNPSIMIPNNITYTATDGSVSLGLLAENNILVTYFAPNNLTINAALIAQNGSAQRYYFSGNIKGTLTLFGSMASFGVWTWSWVNGSGTVTSGYQVTNTTYDSNLLFSPPPSFPLSSSGYQQITWSSN